jgi:NitT/TauT family transport system substrate-binding protein
MSSWSHILAVFLCLTLGTLPSRPAETAFGTPVRLAIQKTGTVAWGLAVARAHELDRQAGLAIDTLELASPESSRIALRGGAVDIIVSDWLWVSRERALGAKLVFYPYSSAVGAVMVPADSAIKAPADLKGKSLAVAGGPIDKSWLLLQAAMQQEGIDLAKEASIVYGAPALLFGKMLQGETDAVLNYWNFCARLEAQGFRRLVGIEDLLPKFGVSGQLAMVGYVFDETWAAKNPDVIARFLDMTHKANQLLLTSDAEWDRIAKMIDPSERPALAIYRQQYRRGIPRRPVEAERADARILYRALAKLGGPVLVGDGKELASGTFYRPRVPD